MDSYLFIVLVGFFTGILGGAFGIGGGMIIVPFLLIFGLGHVEAVATSSFGIFLTSLSGTLQNFKNNQLEWSDVLTMGFGAVLAAFFSAYLLHYIPTGLSQLLFSCLLLSLPFLNKINVANFHTDRLKKTSLNSYNFLIGAFGGFLAGFFGIGGGVVLVPLQRIVLSRPLKKSIVISLGVVAFASCSASFQYILNDKVYFVYGALLGMGGFLGAKLSIMFLPKIDEKYLERFFNLIVLIVSAFFFYKSFKSILT